MKKILVPYYFQYNVAYYTYNDAYKTHGILLKQLFDFVQTKVFI